jgi:hypothetical protein
MGGKFGKLMTDVVFELEEEFLEPAGILSTVTFDLTYVPRCGMHG